MRALLTRAAAFRTFIGAAILALVLSAGVGVPASLADGCPGGVCPPGAGNGTVPGGGCPGGVCPPGGGGGVAPAPAPVPNNPAPNPAPAPGGGSGFDWTGLIQMIAQVVTQIVGMFK